MLVDCPCHCLWLRHGPTSKVGTSLSDLILLDSGEYRVERVCMYGYVGRLDRYLDGDRRKERGREGKGSVNVCLTYISFYPQLLLLLARKMRLEWGGLLSRSW